MNTYTRRAPKRGAKVLVAGALVFMMVAALAVPATAFAANSTSSSTKSASTSTSSSTQVAAGTNTGAGNDSYVGGSTSGNEGLPPEMMNSDGSVSVPSDGFDASKMLEDFDPSTMQGGPGGRGGMNPALLAGGIGLIALALGFAGGFAVGRMTGKKAAKKELASAPAIPATPVVTTSEANASDETITAKV